MSHPALTLRDSLLEKIQIQSKLHENRKAKGHRFQDPTLVNFCLNAWIIGGRRFYEILHANSKGGLPSPRTVERKLANYNVPLKEGEINVDSLKKYLLDQNLPLVVSIAEDATAIVAKREYCSSSNSIMGASLPLQLNGLPNAQHSVVSRAEEIVAFFEKYDKASVVVVVMAQPLCDKVSPFRICSFASNNKFTAEDVKNRAETIEKSLKEAGIEILTYSADGDSRELKMMRHRLHLGWNISSKTSNNLEYFFISSRNNIYLCYFL